MDASVDLIFLRTTTKSVADRITNGMCVIYLVEVFVPFIQWPLLALVLLSDAITLYLRVPAAPM